MTEMMPTERVESKIYVIRGQKVMLDYDLAELYQVKTKRLNEQVGRNGKRFPGDFMFSLTKQEIMRMSQIATSSSGEKLVNLKYHKNMHAFTEQGIAMLSSVLNSERAIQVNILIMRAFVKFRSFLSNHKELEQKLNLLEAKFGGHLEKHDEEIQAIFEAMRRMLTIEERPKRRIGFVNGE
jgi:ORF6N domain